MKLFNNFLRILVGGFFLFSGGVKAIDPLGLSFKLKEFFAPSVFNLPFLEEFTTPIAIFIILLEITLGAFILTNIGKRFTLSVAIALVFFFGFLTLFSAITGKVTDCGCFGDFLKLEPWHSFYKNLLLLFLLLPLWLFAPFYTAESKFKSRFSFSLFLFLISVFLIYYGTSHLPLVDFRAYSKNSDVVQKMKTAKELGLEPTKNKILYTLVNDKTKEEIQVDDSIYIAQNWWEKPEWKIDTTRNEEILAKKGYEPPIQNFVINCNGQEKTFDYLSQEKFLLISAYYPQKLNPIKTQKIDSLLNNIPRNKGELSIIVASPETTSIEATSCVMDATLLKTINRANPGVTLFREGKVINKYHWNDIPETKELLEEFDKN